METANRIAFKEWAVICAALERRGQIAILRKGGIHEGRQGFRVAYPEFWLFPTYLHQSAPGLVVEAQSLLEDVSARQPPEETVRLEHYAVVERVFHLTDESQLNLLEGHHLWSAQTVRERFHYREPGLFLLLVRVYKIPQALELDNTPYFAGCRSWIELREPLATAGCQPVLQRRRVRPAGAKPWWPPLSRQARRTRAHRHNCGEARLLGTIALKGAFGFLCIQRFAGTLRGPRRLRLSLCASWRATAISDAG